MGAERVNQVEYDVSNNIKVNLKTGRLLFTYNIINLFKDEYNLNLNLIYNHKNELDPNMNPLLGSFFRLDINEYIQRTGNLIYYIDSLDRYYLSESYYETTTEIHKHFNDESGLTLIVYKNDDNIIRLKDDFGNIKEFTRLANQSENTYYYVLTKKTIYYNNETSISYFYNYDSDNRLTSVYNNLDNTRRIEFGYNDLGFINHIYINYNNMINGIRLKYNINNEIIAIKKITNSIEEIGYVLRYSNNLLDALVDYKLKEVYTFEYEANSNLIKTKKGYINLKIKEENNKFASEYTYVSDLIIDNYVKNDEEVYVIRDIDITTNKNIIFTYNTSNSNTIVKKEVSNNDEVNTSYIYYYDAFGKSTTTFEYVTNNNLIYYKNTNTCKGIELLGSSNQSYQQNNNLLINNLKPYQFEDCLSNIPVSQSKISSLNNYHTKNISKCNDTKLIYNVNTYLKINQIYKNNKLAFEISYEDNSFQLIEKRINIVKTDEWFNFTCAIELEKKRISSIFIYMISDNDYNKYSISNMYIYLGSKSIEEVSYLDDNNQRQIVLLENQNELKYIMVGSTIEVPITLNNSGSEYYNYLSFSDLVLTYHNYLRDSNSFDLVYSSSNHSKKRIKVKLLKIKFNLSSYASLNNNIEIINESYNYFTNYINQKTLKYESVTLPSGTITNLLCIDTKASIISNNNQIDKHSVLYFNLNLNNILNINEEGLKTYIEYDNYNRIVSQSLYGSGNVLLQNASKTYTESCDTESNILGINERYYNNFGLLSSIRSNGINNNPHIINYQKNELNQLNCVSDNNENHKNLIRYNNKGLIVEEFNKDQNRVINHFYEYDNYNRLSNYYRLNSLIKNSNTAYNINYSYNNHTNTITKRTRINDNTLDETKYKFDRYGNLEKVYESNDLKIVYNYDYSNKLESINDFTTNIDYNYTYDENNNVFNIISYDQNLDLNRYSIDFDDYGYYVSLYDDTINNDNKVIYNDNLINKKVKKIYSKYHTNEYTYNNMDNIQTIKTIYANDNEGIEDYKTEKTNNYKVINGVTSSLIDSVVLEAKILDYLLDKFTLSNSYNSKLNMISSYSLLKENYSNNTLTFSNKYKYDFEYNNSLEVSKDKVTKYNNNTVIEYKETNYTYDTLGNIMSINKKYGENEQSISINKTNVYTYNNGLLERITSFDSSYRSFTYDYYGNTTNIKHYNNSNLLTKEEFIYSFNKLIRYKVYNDSRNIITDYSYIYDHNNIRIKKINNLESSIIDYIVYDNNILYSDGLLFIYNGSELIGFNYNDKTYSYVKDITGNIIAIIRDGIEIVRYIYDAFGNMEVYGYDNNGDLVLNNSDSFIGNINPFRYKSYYLDKESGLYYLNSRYYNSEVGRFISPDDISCLYRESISGLNLYCFLNNNPIGIERDFSNCNVNSCTGKLCLQTLNGAISRGAFFTSVNDFSIKIPQQNWISFGIDITSSMSGALNILGWTLKNKEFYDFLYSAYGITKYEMLSNLKSPVTTIASVISYALVAYDVYTDVLGHINAGDSLQKTAASGIVTAGVGIFNVWASAKVGAIVGTAIGGVPGFIIGTVAGVVIGIFINGIFYTKINGKSIAGYIEDGIEGFLNWLSTKNAVEI